MSGATDFVPTTVDADAANDLVAALRSRIDGDVDTASRRLAEYSTDASNYRIVPSAVAFPRTVDELATITDEARERGVPLHLRGAGTSIAGNAIGRGLVVDTSRHLNRIHSIDAEARTARVDPGVVVARLQDAAKPYGLRFGPDPSTWTRCTIGGMAGNNACGSHSLSFGRTAENIVDLDIIDGLGRRFTAADDLSVVPGLNEFVRRHLATIRLEFGRFGRQVSGYALEALLPERQHSLKDLLVGSEGTLGVITGATVRLVPMPNAPVTVVLGYPSMVAAANDVPALLACKPGAVEGLDARLVTAVREAKGAAAVESLPEGAGWLLIEMPGESLEDALERSHALVAASSAISHMIQPDAALARPIWRIREDGVGLAGRPGGTQAWPGFEDAAVPPDRLGEYLERFEQLTAKHGIDGMSYGHFGDGCIHVRLTFPLHESGKGMRAFMLDAGDLVAEFGGSISGEHGDGRARGELLPKMYSPAAIEAFRELKALFDPKNVLNPDVLVDPAPLDLDLRRPHALPIPRVRGGFAFEHDGGDFTNAVHRCVGMGKCRADNGGAGGFMCPSYQATRDEKDSTRARARVLQEVANGSLGPGAWSSREVDESLDLCLSCKACSTDCPAGVDMAQYKSEALYRAYKGRVRPMRHYVLGQLPRWTPLMSALAPIVNATMSVDWLRRLVLPIAGVDKRRRIPRVAPRTFREHRRRAVRRGRAVAPDSPVRAETSRVMVWTDSFSNGFAPGVGADVVRVLEAAGLEVVTPEQSVCCGLTWISTGQLDGARARLTRLMDAFAPVVDAGVPIVGVEPSCTAVLRSDLLDLFPDDPRAKRIAASTFTLAEVLSSAAPVKPADDWSMPSLDGVELIVQPHCHQYSVLGFHADRALLDAAGASVTQLAGCCGLAGNFGLEKGHYETSVAVAENALLPALRQAPDGARFLADGFSCRTQAEQLGDTTGVHLATLIAERL
ncbi:oxidoreductase [Pseudoclavibacter endophyticus]|nr:oxidoreductase [Pseudoclavibacter endophyticus]